MIWWMNKLWISLAWVFNFCSPTTFIQFYSFSILRRNQMVYMEATPQKYDLPHLANFGQFAIFRGKLAWNGCLEIAAGKCAHIYQTRLFCSYFPPNSRYCTKHTHIWHDMDPWRKKEVQKMHLINLICGMWCGESRRIGVQDTCIWQSKG